MEFNSLRYKAHLMGLDLLQVINVSLPEYLTDEFHCGVARLNEGFPLDYLIGYLDIGSIRIHTPEGVFIPRPETIAWLPSVITELQGSNIAAVVDYCAGTGLISCSLSPVVDRIYAIEKSPLAFEYLRRSIATNQQMNINCIKSDSLNSLPDFYEPWALVSNPPYVPEKNIDKSVKFEPSSAIYAGSDGLTVFNEMLSVVQNMENKPTMVLLELDPENILSAAKSLDDIGYSTDIKLDIEERDRFIHAILT